MNLDKAKRSLESYIADVFSQNRARLLEGKTTLTVDMSGIVRFLGCYSGNMVIRKQGGRRVLIKKYSFRSETGDAESVKHLNF